MNLTGRAALLTFTAALAAVAMLSACSSPGKKARHINLNTLRQCDLLDADWLFHRGDVTDSNAVAAAEFDDSQWRPVHLPHDYGLDATYNPTNTRSQGYLPFTVAWYRKHLSIPASDSGKVLRLDFDGVFRNSQVWLNGTCLGKHLSGYTPFSYDITKLAKLGADPLLPNEDNTTPLMVAAGVGTRSPGEDAGTDAEVLEAVKVALELGNDPNAVDKNGETAMHGAAYKQVAPAAQYLLDHGAKIEDFNKKNSHGWTPLRIADGVHRGMNLRASPETAAVLRKAMAAAGVSTVVEPEENISGATK